MKNSVERAVLPLRTLRALGALGALGAKARVPYSGVSRSRGNSWAALVCAGAMVLASGGSQAAMGEMGRGIPGFASYGAVVGDKTMVWSLAAATIPMPSGCTSLMLSSSTLGANGYKLAVATLLAARLAGKQVRFYAHAERDGGCGVDYVELE